MILDVHPNDELAIDDNGVRVHAVVHEVVAWGVWLSRDDLCCDVLYALDDRRLSWWVAS